MSIRPGFPESQREEVARLFWQAFAGKLGPVLGPGARARSFLVRVLDPGNALSAIDAEGRLLGVAGIKTERGGLVGGSLRDLAAIYGWGGALWRGPLLDLTDRPLEAGQLMMDGLFVAENARGQGVGTALIAAVTQEARRQGHREVRLDVIDSNARARALYERLGFHPSGETRMGPLALLFGFRRKIAMVRPVPPLSVSPSPVRPS